jgi:hypothetical protein
MSLKDALAGLSDVAPKPKNAIVSLLESLDDEDREALLTALRDRRISCRTLGHALESQGLCGELNNIPQAIQRWRDRDRLAS